MHFILANGRVSGQARRKQNPAISSTRSCGLRRMIHAKSHVCAERPIEVARMVGINHANPIALAQRVRSRITRAIFCKTYRNPHALTIDKAFLNQNRPVRSGDTAANRWAIIACYIDNNLCFLRCCALFQHVFLQRFPTRRRIGLLDKSQIMLCDFSFYEAPLLLKYLNP